MQSVVDIRQAAEANWQRVLTARSDLVKALFCAQILENEETAFDLIAQGMIPADPAEQNSLHGVVVRAVRELSSVYNQFPPELNPAEPSPIVLEFLALMNRPDLVQYV